LILSRKTKISRKMKYRSEQQTLLTPKKQSYLCVLTMTTRNLPLTLLLMMVIISAGSLLQLQSVSATFPGKNGRIAFERGQPQQIFTVNPDGSGLTQLTNTGGNRLPRWSADGTKIVFQSERNVRDAIWVMNADGSGQTQVTHSSYPSYDPAFSPDGSKIVFVNGSSGFQLWVTNIDGSNQKALTTGPDSDFTPVWSPDGSKIVFRRQLSNAVHIFVMNAADGSGPTDVSKDPNAQDYGPEWSPDGRMIAFFSSPSWGIWVMNVDGSGRKQLSSPPPTLADETPAWSPDGTKIAFFRGHDSIWVMNADGSNQIDITKSQPNSDTDYAPNWQPLFANPVGGVVLPTSKIDIVAPLAALAGLIAAVSAVIAVKKRRD
jgi:Tol biopolymer transport system component